MITNGKRKSAEPDTLLNQKHSRLAKQLKFIPRDEAARTTIKRLAEMYEEERVNRMKHPRQELSRLNRVLKFAASRPA